MNFVEPLTKREKDTFDLLVKGLTNKEIAHELGGLSYRTIEDHVTQILQKSGLQNRKQVISKYNESI